MATPSPSYPSTGTSSTRPTAASSRARKPRWTDDYDAFRNGLWRVLDGYGGGPIFTTDAQDLFALFLDLLPVSQRQTYTCNTCRRFVEAYGNLAWIDDKGNQHPLLWKSGVGGHSTGICENASSALYKAVKNARITGVFLATESTWGAPTTGAWNHLAVEVPLVLRFKSTPLLTASQATAAKKEEHGMLQRGLADFPPAVVAQAVALLSNDALYRSEKVVGVARWLEALHAARGEAKGQRAKDNVTWKAVATAPPGFCHVRSTMIGTLLEDLARGMPFEAVKRKFREKMDPTAYQRPTAPPSEGNIRQAEKVVEVLGSAGALARRFARLEDVLPHALWVPGAGIHLPPVGGVGGAGGTGGVFDHLRRQGRGDVPPVLPFNTPPVVVTWEKFKRTVLPTAKAISLRTPQGLGPFYALTTAVDASAAPLLQWDVEGKRNPVSWYTYSSGAHATAWNTPGGAWVDVAAVTYFPHQWGRRDEADTTHAHHGDGVLFILDACRDTSYRGGAILFPEHLKAEYHGVRHTLEAYAQSSTLLGKDEASACGIGLRKGQAWNNYGEVQVVPRSGPAVVYRLDRWD